MSPWSLAISVTALSVPVERWARPGGRRPARGRALSGAPPRFGLDKAGAAVDQRGAARAAGALVVGGLLVDLEGRGVEGHAVVLERAADGDEAAGDVLAHSHRVAGERVAPAAAAARLEAQQIAALHPDPVALAGQLAFAGRARVQ